MKEITQIENQSVEIWRRPYQRSMNLTVRPDGRVRVTCGRRMRLAEIARFVRESQPFIRKRMLENEALRAKYPEKTFISGECFLFFGSRLPLDVIWTWRERIELKAFGDRIEMLAPLKSGASERRSAFQSWFRREARPHLNKRVVTLAAAMSLFPRQVTIRGQTTRWGSCSQTGTLSLNWKLLCAPAEIIDYVVVHELAHLEHLDHSPAFWDLVGRFHPEWKKSRRWLREHEAEIAVQFR